MLGGMLAGHDEGGGKVVTKHIATGGAYKTIHEHLFLLEEQNFIQFYGHEFRCGKQKAFWWSKRLSC